MFWLNDNAFLDSLVTNDQFKVLEGIKDQDKKLLAREGIDNFNQVMWNYSDPRMVESGIPKSLALKNYRSNLSKAGKLKPWTDKTSETYDDQMLIPGLNYNYKP